MECNNDMHDIQLTWKKIENIAKKTGIREGISDGRDQNFQKSFDLGFEEGFKNGFLLGKCKGMLMADARQNSSEVKSHKLLENVSRGSCELCRNSILSADEDVQKIIELQRECYRNNNETISSHLKEGTSKT